MKKRNVTVRVFVTMDLEMRPETFARFRADKKEFDWYVLRQFRNHTRTLRSAILEGPIVEDDARLQASP